MASSIEYFGIFYFYVVSPYVSCGLVLSADLRGRYKLETQRTASCVPINSAAKHLEHNGETLRSNGLALLKTRRNAAPVYN